MGVLMLVLALFYTRMLFASLISGVIVAIGAYFTMYVNEKGRARAVFTITSGSSGLAILVFWLSGLRDFYAALAGIALTFVASLLWYYVTIESYIHRYV